MSFMALKLIGKEKLSHVVDLNFDYGLGTFAGLNIILIWTSTLFLTGEKKACWRTTGYPPVERPWKVCYVSLPKTSTLLTFVTPMATSPKKKRLMKFLILSHFITKAKVDFDIAMTLIANTLYKALSSKFKLFAKAKPKTTYRSFVEGDAKITITSDTVQVKFGKKSFNPLIMDFVNSLPKINVPWMNHRTLEYSFEQI